LSSAKILTGKTHDPPQGVKVILKGRRGPDFRVKPLQDSVEPAAGPVQAEKHPPAVLPAFEQPGRDQYTQMAGGCGTGHLEQFRYLAGAQFLMAGQGAKHPEPVFVRQSL
jgi:hypothetical protein